MDVVLVLFIDVADLVEKHDPLLLFSLITQTKIINNLSIFISSEGYIMPLYSKVHQA